MFDVDRDAYWNLAETSEVQLATEGAEMNDEASLLTVCVFSVRSTNGIE